MCEWKVRECLILGTKVLDIAKFLGFVNFITLLFNNFITYVTYFLAWVTSSPTYKVGLSV